MSSIDQAFLKAYRAGPTPRASDAAAPDRYSQTAETSPWGMSPGVALPPHAVVPAPHANFASAASARLRAAFEVPRFSWPATVGDLITQGVADFHALAGELVHRARQGRKVQYVVGPRRGVGCSTVTLLLARVAAAQGLTVAVADADARHPQLADLLGVEAQLGWIDVLAHGWTVDEALIESMEEHITLLPWRSTSPAARPAAGVRGLAGTLTALRTNYDLVLVDAPPVDSDPSAVDQAAVLAGSPIDDALLVHDGHSGAEQLAAAGRRLAALGIVRWDVVENFVRDGFRISF